MSAKLGEGASLAESEANPDFLNRLGAETAPLVDADQILATTTRLLGEYLQLSVCAYADMDDDENGFTIRGDWAAPGATSIVGHYSLADFGSLAVKNLSAGKPLVLNDNLRELPPEEAATFQDIGLAATVCMPLVKEGRLIALMAIHDRVPRLWTDAEIALLREVTARSWAHVERVAAIAELRASEARYRVLFESIAAGFCTVEVRFDEPGGRTDYRVVEANAAFYEQTGFSRDIFRCWLREAAPDLEEHWYEIYGRIARTGEPERFERGSAVLGRWFDVHAFRVGEPQDRRVAILFNDISARRHAEERLRDLNETLERRVAERTAELTESKRRFQGIFNSAFQFMALLTPDGTIVEINQTALAWSDIEPSDIIGRPFWLAAPMRDNPALQSAIEAGVRRAAAGETVRAEHVMRGAGEVRATVDFSVKPVLGERGEPAFLVAEGRDVTALKEAQEALRQSQKMDAMGQLTGGVAHDFNNLLTPIVGSLDLLQRKGVGNDREQRLIDGAMQSAERAKTLVQRLLAFARRQPLQTQAVDVRGLVEGMADLVASTSGPKVTVQVDVADDLPAAKADANQVEMAILNLAVNARDAMPEGGTLTISAKLVNFAEGEREGVRAGRYVRLAVADTGVGMDEATLARAVEPFFSTKGIGRGTGLGLSMVHGLASQLGGDLGITSKPGLGTCVELYLPASGEAAAQPPQGEGTQVKSAGGIVLLVDDEELVRTSTADMLVELGYSVVEAGSAEEALRLIDGGQPFDMLLTDHLMPGLSGIELVRELRERRADVPVLVVSGYSEVEGVAPDLPRLVKPFRQSDLAAKLRALDGEAIR